MVDLIKESLFWDLNLVIKETKVITIKQHI